MDLTPEQEAEWFKQLDQTDPISIRENLKQGLISSGYVNATYRYLAGKDREERERIDASNSAQIALMRRASEAAERQATAAERANTRATIALVIAIISMIISAVAIFITHRDSANERSSNTQTETKTH